MVSVALTAWTAAGVAAACWLLSLITREHSWVDRLWSIVPFVYAWEAFAQHASTRGLVMAILATAWGLRLTFNFARKGGYTGTEDYRWEVLRQSMTPWQFQLFNAGFIATGQNALLWFIASPALVAAAHRRACDWVDVILAVIFLALLIMETVADQQQWNFHQRKKANGGALAPGFCDTGLFAISRHPNYFAEIAQWWVFCGFGLHALGTIASWLWLAPVALTGLFIGSTRFTEQLSAPKYPDYASYQRRVSTIIPWFPRRDA
jgi:steroid 5-alpha reductase family enzyme